MLGLRNGQTCLYLQDKNNQGYGKNLRHHWEASAEG